MNIGLLKGIIRNLDYSSKNIIDVLYSENNNLNYENEKRLINAINTLNATTFILGNIVDEESIKSEDGNKSLK